MNLDERNELINKVKDYKSSIEDNPELTALLNNILLLNEEEEDDILALQAALDKANEKLAYVIDKKPPIYDCEAGRQQLQAWAKSFVCWFDVNKIEPRSEDYVLVTDGTNYAIAHYNLETKTWNHDIFGLIEKENEDDKRMEKITHWRPYPKYLGGKK